MLRPHSFTSLTGKVRAEVTCSPNLGASNWLIRVPKPGWHLAPGIFVKEARFIAKYKNVAKFQYLSGACISLDLTSDLLLATLSSSTGIKEAFPITGLNPDLLFAWNTYADFRIHRPSSCKFQGVELEAVEVFDIRPKSGVTPAFYPRHARFCVGEIVSTKFEPDDAVPGVNYGYARVERVSDETEPLGLDTISLVTYTIRRSWKGISTQDWNQFSRLKDYIQGDIATMDKLPSSVQSKIRRQLFDPYYR